VILVDTSVWIDHLRIQGHRLSGLLDDGMVMTHEFVVGELACGTMRRRSEVLALLRNLPHAPAADTADVLAFVDANALAGAGIGWIDAHLLAAARLAGVRLWTKDARLMRAAKRLGVPF
jgi:predicted nucleic acid-binding protein